MGEQRVVCRDSGRQLTGAGSRVGKAGVKERWIPFLHSVLTILGFGK